MVTVVAQAETETEANAGPPTARGKAGPFERGVRWATRLLYAALGSGTAVAFPILLERRIAQWFRGDFEGGSVGEAIGLLGFDLLFAAPISAVLWGLLPAMAAGTVLLAIAIRNQWARRDAIWAAAGIAISLFAVSTSWIDEIDAFVLAVTVLSGLGGGLIFRQVLSPGGRFDEAADPPAPLSGLEHWGYSILGSLWPLGYFIILGGIAYQSIWDPFLLFFIALLPLAVFMVVAGRRKRLRLGASPETRPLPSV